MCWLPRSAKLGLRGLHKWFTQLSTTLLYPWVGQVWVTSVLVVSEVAGVLGMWRGDCMPTFQFQFQILNYFSLIDDFVSTSNYEHTSGKVFELAPIPGYFFDGYTRYPGKY